MMRRFLLKFSLLFLVATPQIYAQQPVNLSAEAVFTNFPQQYSIAAPRNSRSTGPVVQQPAEIRHVHLRGAQQSVLRSLRSCGLESFQLSMENNRTWICRAFLDTRLENLPQEFRNKISRLHQARWNHSTEEKVELQQTCDQIIQRKSLAAPRAIEQHVNQILGSESQWQTFRNINGSYQSSERRCSVEPLVSISLSKRDPTLSTPRMDIDCKPQVPQTSIQFTPPRQLRNQERVLGDICERGLCANSYDHPELCTQMGTLISNTYPTSQISMADVRKVLTDSFSERRGALFLPIYRQPRASDSPELQPTSSPARD